jgi:transcription-repair coupling factor (superfamily II helicase)
MQQPLETGETIADAAEDEKVSAYLPVNYINDSHQRIQMYRKFAEAMDLASLESLKRELRDRFGLLPPPVEMLVAITELRILAAKAGISSIETKEDKLMMTRNGELMTVDGKFPRLRRKSAKARLNEIRKLLVSLSLPREVGMPSRLRNVA